MSDQLSSTREVESLSNVHSEMLKLYQQPAIVHELKLETRAGSPLLPLGGPLGKNPADPLGLNPGNNPR
jgi:hypothetical protein